MSTLSIGKTQARPERNTTEAQIDAAGIFEKRFVPLLIAFTVFLATLPCLYGYAITRSGFHYAGAVYDIDDTMVYYSWTSQAADGHLVIRNLFTTAAQHPIQFNVLFLVLGQIVRFTGLPIPIVFLIAKIAVGAGLLVLIYRFFSFALPNDRVARLSAFFIACLGGGFGWLYYLRGSDSDNLQCVAADIWQPESMTFQSIEMSLLFPVSQLLMVGVIYLLFLGQKTGQNRFAVWAGVAALLLGNIHSYDIIHLAFAWGLYLIVITLIKRRFIPHMWLQALICAGIGLASTIYQYYMFVTDPIWHARVMVLTVSPPFLCYIRGFGLILLYAVLGFALLCARRFKTVSTITSDPNSIVLAACWFIGALLAVYGPHSSFQRRMIMGADIPLSLLAGCGVAILTADLPRVKRTIMASLCCLATCGTPFAWAYRDMHSLAVNTSIAEAMPYLTTGQLDALDWIRTNTKPSDAILAEPSLAIFVPGWCDRTTFFGHWGETPDYQERVRQFDLFTRSYVSIANREKYLASTDADYFVFTKAREGATIALPIGRSETIADFGAMPQILRPVYANSELTVYKILAPHSAK